MDLGASDKHQAANSGLCLASSFFVMYVLLKDIAIDF